ncbi:GNAT family N-acetyltransferase [Polynucleobacter sp. HIN5]|uniref:GNAT family N-acetyltransferase n=1 Tax=Polynucleobacter sp. HIN5 TaxID=3047864 RepID=UPI002574311E|nr:GNAT family N-acetyltransferase [Polynucleobacter sp. HIN5]BEI34033.1 GNAT family N-acetyltransferase [Polynucleobacter sp. HIN5]
MQEMMIMRWEEARHLAYPIRLTVFVNEQQVPEELELDEDDPTAWHAVVLDHSKAIATGRLLRNGKIGRLAILKEYRGLGLGSELLKTLVSYGRQEGIKQFFLHAQTTALDFYQRHGFKAIGPVFNEAGIDHIKMILEPT